MMEFSEKVKEWQVGWLRRNVLRVLMTFGYVLTRVKFIHNRLPRDAQASLPVAWNDHMWWVALKSGGDKIFGDYYSKLKIPASFAPKTEVAPEYQLTEAEIQSFYENGFIGPFDLISTEEAHDLQMYLEGVVEKAETSVYPPGTYELPDRLKDATQTDRSALDIARLAMATRDRHLDDPRILDLFRRPALTERVAQLLGSDLMIWRSQFFGKRPGEIGTAWHQATTYVYESLKEHLIQPPDIDELFDLSCFVSVTDAMIENGCLCFLPGTQKEILPINVQIFNPQKDRGNSNGNSQVKRFGSRKIEIDYPIREEDIVPVELKAGQLLIFTERVLHGSLDNISQDKYRLSVTGRVARPDTRIYTDRMLRDGHELKLISVKKIMLDNWRAVMLRGEDEYGYNRSVPVHELPPLMQKQEVAV
ncbi:MAG: hypothetical protein HC921_16385 [Synechococcaceae cyanobacterium SM2_3_1]|nr:hypothetical protein [Synechococcaceae cyanobacterium SM2_3_1]